MIKSKGENVISRECNWESRCSKLLIVWETFAQITPTKYNGNISLMANIDNNATIKKDNPYISPFLGEIKRKTYEATIPNDKRKYGFV
ncbi:hypothetical protein MASR2M66_12210 [Chloroflexota bacterium]